jgi:putative ATP-dependent endonuclease of OLD family
MQISKIYISNYRAISEIEAAFFSISSILGANNCGKSTIFKAIELFFGAASRVSIDDFHRQDVTKPIIIRITFRNFTLDEIQEFGSAIIDGEMIISREFSLQDSVSPNYSVFARSSPRFDRIRMADAASERLAKYREIQSELGLPSVRSAADADAAILAWEQSHSAELEVVPIRGFFGATNVANGKLRKRTSLRLIPAVRDTIDEAKTGRKSPVLELLADITRQTFENRSELKEFLVQAELRINELTDPSTIPELAEISGKISDIVRFYYADSSVVTNWDKVEALSVNYPKPKISVENDGLITDVDFVGHGLQRVILFSLIQYMAERSSAAESSEDEFASAQSDIILLIEEPEIYQHPIKQHILYRNFARIVSAFNKANGIRFQIIFTTHSEKFVSMRDFEICNVLRKNIDRVTGVTNTIKSIRLDDCCRDLAACHEPAVTPMSGDAFAAKLHVFTREICEGFFAEKLIFVEGVTDKCILEGYYSSIGRDNNLESIQIIAVGGKSMIDKPAYIFDRLGIKNFVVFDNDNRFEDGQKKQKSIKQNRFLQRVLGVQDPVDMPVGCNVRFYAYDGSIETYLRSIIGVGSYDQQFEQLAVQWGLTQADIKKSPSAYALMIEVAAKGGYEFEELHKIVNAVDSL